MSNFYISKLKINWYKHLSFEGVANFESGVNILLGKNGSGKTSILELIRGASNQENPGVPLNENEITDNSNTYYTRLTFNSPEAESSYMETPKTNQPWQNGHIFPSDKLRYITSSRVIKNELSVSNIFKIPGFNIPDPGTEINVSDEFNKAIISEMLEAINEVKGRAFTQGLEEAYRKGLVDFEKDIKIDFDRDNPVFFVDHKNREVSIFNLSSGEKEYLYFYAFLRRIRSDENKIILIDEPELHLHGNQIRKLCELITELSEKNQIIIATHSSDVLHHFLRFANIILVEKGKLSNPKLGDEVSDAIEQLGIPVDPSFFTSHWICAENKSRKNLTGDLSPTTQEALKWIFGNKRGKRYWSFGGSRVNIESSIELLKEASTENSDAKLSVILDGDKLSTLNSTFPPVLENAKKIPGVLYFPVWEIENIFLNPNLINACIDNVNGKSGNEILWNEIEKNKEILVNSFLKTTVRNTVRQLWRDNFFDKNPIEDLKEWKLKVADLSDNYDDSVKIFEKVLNDKEWRWIPGKEVLKILLEVEPGFWNKSRILFKDGKLSELIECDEIANLRNSLED